MSITAETSRVSYSGNGVTTAFSFPYPFLLSSDLVVISVDTTTKVETVKTLTTHYTVSGAGGGSGGTITMLVAPTSGQKLIIYRDPPLTQTLELTENDILPVDEIEKSFDKLTQAAQRADDRGSRSLRLPEGFYETLSTVLPADITAKGGFLVGLNEDADGFEYLNPSAISASVEWGGITGTLSTQSDLADALADKAPLDSPALAGSPTAPTPTPGDNSTKLATTEYVDDAVAAGGGGASDWGDLGGTLSDQTDLQSALDLKAPLANPAFSGNPTAPTQAPLDSSTNVATTEYVDDAVAAGGGGGGTWGTITGTLSDQTDLGTALSGKQPLDATLTAVAAYNTNGILTQTAADTFTGRTITGTTDTVSVTNGSGVSGNPTITIAPNPILPGTGFVTVPAGTLAQRPGSPAEGMIRYNTDSDQFEGYANGTWAAFAGPGAKIAAIINGTPQSSYTANTPIIFPTVISDTNSAYNNTTGEFTAPRSDYYLVGVSANTNIAANNYVSIYVAGVAQQPIIGNAHSTSGIFSGFGLCYATAGQVITVRASANWSAVGAGINGMTVLCH